MNEKEYAQWREDAFDALLRLYSEEDANTVLDWFDNIKGSREQALIGIEEFDAMVKFTGIGFEERVWSLYNTMMARMFMYAPLILKEGRDE